MALNNSGPISLGGSTVGQSINLELGNAATALASINSTQFRTLAGVASGTIALSNFYGKSSTAYFVTWMGNLNSAGVPILGGPTVLTNNGYIAIKLQNPGGFSGTLVGFLSPDGAKFQVWGYPYNSGAASGIQPFLTDWSTTGTLMISDGSFYYFVNSASPGTVTGNRVSTGNQFGYYRNGNVSRDASNNTYYYAAAQPNPKYEGEFAFRKFNSSSAFVWGRGAGLNASQTGNNGRSQLCLVQTDGRPILCFSPRIFRSINPAGTGTQYDQYFASGFGEFDDINGAAIDASNNIWIACSGGPLLRQLNAARTTLTGYNFQVTGDGSSTSIRGMAHYNGYIYILARASDTTNTYPFYISAFNSTTGAEYWTKKITFTGTNANDINGGSAWSFGNELQANGQGVALAFDISNGSLSSGGYANRMYIKLPLNGSLTTTTYSNIANNASGTWNISLTVTTVSRTWTNMGSVGVTTSTPTTYGSSASASTPAAATNYTSSGYLTPFYKTSLS